MAFFEVAYQISAVSSGEAELLPDGGRWKPDASKGTAWVDLAWGTEFSIHSISFLATGVSRVQVILQGRKGERGSWFGAGSTPSTFAVATNAIEAYDGVLPTAAECKRWLTCKSSGDGLRPLASQGEWTGLRLVLTPVASAGETFCLRKLEVNRQPSERELQRLREEAGNTASQPAPVVNIWSKPAAATARAPPFGGGGFFSGSSSTSASVPTHAAGFASDSTSTTSRQQPQQQRPPPPAAPAGSRAFLGAGPPPDRVGIGGGFSGGYGGHGGLGGHQQASSTARPAFKAGTPSSATLRPGQRAGASVAPGRKPCLCSTHGCQGCGGDKKLRCRKHQQLCVLAKASTAGNKGRFMWMCPLVSTPASPSCGFRDWADEALGMAVPLPEADEDDEMQSPHTQQTGRPAATSRLPPAHHAAAAAAASHASVSAASAAAAAHADSSGSREDRKRERGGSDEEQSRRGAPPQTHSSASSSSSSSSSSASRPPSTFAGSRPEPTSRSGGGVGGLSGGSGSARMRGGGDDDAYLLESSDDESPMSRWPKKAKAAQPATAPPRTAPASAAASSAPPPTPSEILTFGVGELKRRLTAVGVSFVGVIEKSELQDLLKQAHAGRSSGSAAAAGSGDGSDVWRRRAHAAPNAGATCRGRGSTSASRGAAGTDGVDSSRASAAAASWQDADTEDEAEGDGNGAATEEEEEEEEAVVALWPPGRVRCKYELQGDSGCYQKNAKHLGAFAHGAEHVRQAARKLVWTGPKGALFRLLEGAGLGDRCKDCSTEVSQLRVLDSALDAAAAPPSRQRRAPVEAQEKKRPATELPRPRATAAGDEFLVGGRVVTGKVVD